MNAILKYPGSKWRISRWIASYFPEHEIYIEPFFGSGAVFFNKEPSKHEIINDLDGRVVNLFRVCREQPEELARLINLTPYARQEFDSIQEVHGGDELQLTGDEVEDARRFLVRCWQGFGSKLSCRVGWKTSYSTDSSRLPICWGQLPEMIIQVAERLKEAQIEQKPALELIRRCNKPDVLIYADPPYPQTTRGGKLYRFEMMGEAAHVELLTALQKHSGPVVLSGYDNDLYNDMLRGWHKDSRNNADSHSRSRTEVIWMNFERQCKLEG